MTSGAALLAAVLWARPAAAARPPRVVEQRGGCPDLCCAYGSWRARRAVRLYDRPNGRKVAAVVKEGETVTAGDSELFVRPRKVKVTYSDLFGDSPMPKGSTLYLVRPLVDGSWRVWYKGVFVDGVRPIWDASESAKVKSAWWVQVQTGDGARGWTKDGAAAFDGSRLTSCGASN